MSAGCAGDAAGPRRSSERPGRQDRSNRRRFLLELERRCDPAATPQAHAPPAQWSRVRRQFEGVAEAAEVRVPSAARRASGIARSDRRVERLGTAPGNLSDASLNRARRDSALDAHGPGREKLSSSRPVGNCRWSRQRRSRAMQTRGVDARLVQTSATDPKLQERK